MAKVAAIIGVTSSLGQVLAKKLAFLGYDLVLVGRNKDMLAMQSTDLKLRYNADITPIVADFTKTTFSAEKLVKEIGGVDDLYMLPGYMGSGNQEDIEDVARIIRVNFTVPSQLLTLTADKMKKAGQGNIVVVSSVAGDRGRQSNYSYGSAKAGLTAFASGLRNKYAKDKIHVMTVKPGFIDSPATFAMQSPLTASREKIVDVMLKSLKKKRNEIYVPFFWRYIMLIITNIPESIFKRLKL